MVGLRIAGTGSYLPDEIIGNDFFAGRAMRKYSSSGGVLEEKIIDPEKIFDLTGIRERRKARADEHPSDMGYVAAVRAIEKAGVDAGSIVGIYLASVSESCNFPNGATKIQRKLGIRGSCSSCDVVNACAGFTEALMQARARNFTRKGNYLVVASERLTNLIDYTDINATLFGDGAGAALLVPCDDNQGIVGEYSITEPHDGNDMLIFRDKQGFLRMPEGGTVLRKAVRGMITAAEEIKNGLGWTHADVYIPHQANARIIQGVEKAVKEKSPESIVYSTIHKYGNMSSATCAIALDEALRDGTIEEGDKVIVASFGSGLVTSAVGIQF